MRSPYKIVFLSSLSILAFEITLIRVFSIMFSYHYASLIISISMIGLVLGGIYTYFSSLGAWRMAYDKKRNGSGFRVQGSKFFNATLNTQNPTENMLFSLPFFAFLLSLSYPFIFTLSSIIPLDPFRMLWENVQIFYLSIFFILFSIPFFFYGIILSSSFSAYPQSTNRIYASDLVGAALGVALAMLLLNHIRVEFVIVTCSIVLATLLCFSVSNPIVKRLCVVIPLLFNIPIVNGTFTVNISPYKGLMQALKEDGSTHIKTINTSHSRLDVFENPRMKQAPGLSLAYSKPIAKGAGIAIDGDIAGVMLDGKNLSDYGFLPFLPSALPYLLAEPGDVLVIGFKNSSDVFMPYYFGAKHVYAAEKDLSILKFIASHYHKESLYRKSLYPSSGRMLAINMQNPLDIVFISKTGFSPAGAFGLQEDYDTTAEALKLYLSNLRDTGFLFIQMFILPPPRYELRMLNNIISALNLQGIEDIGRRLLAYRSWDTINFLVKKMPFTERELKGAQEFLTDRQFEMIFPYPWTKGKYISGLDYKQLFGNLLNNKKNRAFIGDYPFDIRATTDDRPFFHYFQKLGKIKEVYEMTGNKWAYFLYEGMALPFILIFLIIISVLIFSGTLLYMKLERPKFLSPNPAECGTSQNSKPQNSIAPKVLCYFVCIGFAFMLVEIFLIHKLMLPLDSPVNAFSTVLITLLISSGFGSLMSGRINNKKLMYAMACTPLLLMTYFFFFDSVLQFKLSFASIIPAGVLFGLFFPAGIRFLCINSNIIPLAYAVNGAASIIAPPLASVIAVAYGCRILLVLSLILYCIALIIMFKKIMPNVDSRNLK